MSIKNIKITLLALLMLGVSACEDFLADPIPVDLIGDQIVIEDEATAEQAVLGIYNSLQGAGLYGNLGVAAPGLLSDELDHTGSFPTLAQWDDNEIVSDNVNVQDIWTACYRGIYIANVVISRIGAVQMDEAAKNQFIGEAKFNRALYHFTMANLYGAGPLATTVDLNVLRTLGRTSVEEVYAFAITELEEAAVLLEGVDFGAVGRDEADRFRANEWAVKALLARVLLYSGDVEGAGDVANDVIENGGYSLGTYSANFTPNGNSPEVIFKVFASSNDQNGLAFQFRTTGRYEYGPSVQLQEAYEEGDARASSIEALSDGRVQVVKYVDPGTGTDQPVVLRLAEMYLIRAEANIGFSEAADDLNALRERAGLETEIVGATMDDVMAERFVELAFEGHRWYDLIRTGRVNAVMSAINPATWDNTDVLFPIPINEIRRNPSLVGQQNPGY